MLQSLGWRIHGVVCHVCASSHDLRLLVVVLVVALGFCSTTRTSTTTISHSTYYAPMNES